MKSSKSDIEQHPYAEQHDQLAAFLHSKYSDSL
jgi:hypothetical protein